ncbi:MAG TPA: signal peptidase II [Burkholderiales bacterium]|nr:signal peptidase II [Burkholderiales bacterium]
MLRWLPAAGLIALADQATKWWILSALKDGQPIQVTSFFDLVLAYNRGAAFSFLADQDGWQRLFFIAIAVVASGVIIYLLRKHADEKIFCLGLALILGGALGNLWDRVLLGHVVDFLLFHWQGRAFPAFNLADSAITLGAGLLILDSFRSKKAR